MNSLIFPASNHQTTIISVGDYFHIPTTKDFLNIRNWFNDGRQDSFYSKEISDSFKIQSKVWEAKQTPNKYVWMVTSSHPDWTFSERDTIYYQELFNQAIDDKDDIVFIWGAILIKRINKNLVPFL